MTDARLTPANGRVAASFLKGLVEAPSYVEGTLLQCCASVADILGKPDGRRTAQLIYGDLFLVFEQRNGFAFGQSVHDGYCGYVQSDLLGAALDATHWISAPQTHIYPGANMKLMTEGALYFGSEVAVDQIDGDWAQLTSGKYIPAGHVLPLSTRLNDPVDVADLFLGTPYLWGGSTRYGIDCSGLVQMALRMCGQECPRDSDMQEADLGRDLEAGEEPERGDLAFWKGHVGIITAPNRMLHANAYHMSVAYEPFEEAADRIAVAGGGPVTTVRRL